jgi:hypothetical protein
MEQMNDKETFWEEKSGGAQGNGPWVALHEDKLFYLERIL